MRPTNRLGWALIAGSTALWLAETHYFGWNRYPMSTAEAVLDKVCIAGLSAGQVVLALSRRRRRRAQRRFDRALQAAIAEGRRQFEAHREAHGGRWSPMN